MRQAWVRRLTGESPRLAVPWCHRTRIVSRGMSWHQDLELDVRTKERLHVIQRAKLRNDTKECKAPATVIAIAPDLAQSAHDSSNDQHTTAHQSVRHGSAASIGMSGFTS